MTPGSGKLIQSGRGGNADRRVCGYDVEVFGDDHDVVSRLGTVHRSISAIHVNEVDQAGRLVHRNTPQLRLAARTPLRWTCLLSRVHAYRP
jgi:hypothetical protein